MKTAFLLWHFSALLVASAFAQETSNEPVAVLVKALGAVEGSADGETWTKAERGLDLPAGFSLRVAAASSCVIRFNDGSLLHVRTESQIKIAGARETYVQKGKLAFAIKTNPDAPFKFVSPTAVGAIKGTEGEFEVSDDDVELSIFSSDRADDIADLAFLRDNRVEKVGIGERARFSRDGRLLRRRLSSSERDTFRERLKTLRLDADEGWKFIQKRRQQIEQRLRRNRK